MKTRFNLLAKFVYQREVGFTGLFMGGYIKEKLISSTSMSNI
jgi:hypothetical protein